MMGHPLVSVIIPAKDEAGNLPALLDEIALALSQVDHEVMVVDDASRDDSWSLLTQRAAQDPRLRPLRHEQSAGQSTCIWQAAQAASGTWLATLDGDGQNDPADLPNLLERAQRGDVSLVAGYRTKRHDDWIKRLSSRVANGVRSSLLKDGTPDTGCGLKVIHREAFLPLPYFDHMHRFLPALIQAQGGRCVSVPVNHRPRGAGRSKYGLHDRLWVGIVDIIGVMWLRNRSRVPAPLSNFTVTATDDANEDTRPPGAPPEAQEASR